jgi:hypothetical protein
MKTRTIVTLRELADQIGADVRQLHYLIETGKIPAGERLGKAFIYTEPQARQIADWWQVRQKLVFEKGI